MIKRLKQQPLTRTDRGGNQVGAVVYYDNDWEEYRVVPTINGFEFTNPREHYHTDDKDDAYATAAQMIVEASNKG